MFEPITGTLGFRGATAATTQKQGEWSKSFLGQGGWPTGLPTFWVDRQPQLIAKSQAQPKDNLHEVPSRQPESIATTVAA